MSPQCAAYFGVVWHSSTYRTSARETGAGKGNFTCFFLGNFGHRLGGFTEAGERGALQTVAVVRSQDASCR